MLTTKDDTSDGGIKVDTLDTVDSSHSREQYVAPGLRGLFASPYVVCCAAFSALGGLLFGYDQGVISIVLVMEQFLKQFPRIASGYNGVSSGFWKGLMTAMIELGALLGALTAGYLSDRYSRKKSIIFAVIVFTIGSALQTASIDYAMLIIARLIGGIGIGMLSMVAPLYISEIAPPEIRGTLLVLEEFAIVTGIVIAYWITYGTRYIPSQWSFRLPFVLQIIPGLILGIGVVFLPYSPRWLSSVGRDDEALATLSRIRRLPASHHLVQREILEIRAEVASHKAISEERHPKLHATDSSLNRIKLEIASWIDCLKPGCIRRTHVGVGLMFFQQFVGINALIYYSPTLFETMGLNYDMQLVMSGILNVMQLVGVASSIFTVDRIGRRPLLLWGSAIMFISHLIIAVLVGKFSSNWPSHRDAGWTSVAFLLVYMLAFGASWGPVPWAMPSEIFPSSLRAKGVALSTCSNWLNNFIIGLITPPLVQDTGYGAYVFFAIFCLLSGIWTYFFVMETNGKTLEEMDRVFGDSLDRVDLERTRTIEASLIVNNDAGQISQAQTIARDDQAVA